ncbi:MAG: FeoA family protein [Fervidobacterium sp.]
MSAKKQVSLVDLKAGQSGVVVSIAGGFGATRRLDALGIRVGKKIEKISGMLMRGPVVVKVDETQIGLGYGIASKVIVEV